MGRVLKVFDEERQTFIAIKMLLHEDPQWVARMMREAAAQSQLSHPNICPVYDYGERDGQHYIAMQFIDGERLDDACAGMALEALVRIMVDVTDAVSAAHRAGLVHRDLKPGNILVEASAGAGLRPYVLDFGLVRHVGDRTLTATGELLGTPGYMSPEQATGAAGIDRRSDIFSLGVILYELIAGQLPFDGQSPTQVLLDIASGRARPIEKVRPDLPPPLVRIVHQCLENSPSLRYQDAANLKADLVAYLSGQSVSARRVGLWHRFNRRVRQYPLVSALLGASVLITLAAVALGVRSELNAQERATLAAYYSRESEKLESDLRLAWMKPVHDLSETVTAARVKARDLEASIDRLPATAAGFARLAAGKAYLLVSDFDKAIKLLQPLAQGAPPDPAVAELLTTAYGQQLNIAMTKALQLGNSEIRVQAVNRLRDHYLKQVQPLVESSNSGMSAYFAGRDEQAAAQLERQLDGTAWPVDLLLALSDIYLASASENAINANFSQALKDLDAAAARITQAAQIARSYPLISTASCRLADMFLYVQRDHKEDVAPAQLTDYVALCEKSVVLSPGSDQAHVELARLLGNLAAGAQRRGENPSDLVARSKALADRALDLQPGQTAAQLVTAQVLSVQSSFEASAGKDPLPLLKQAIEAAQSVADDQPGNTDVWMTLAGLQTRAAAMLVAREGGFAEAQPMYMNAASAFRTAGQLPDAPAGARSSLGFVLADHAYHRFLRGLEADSLLEEALTLTQAAAAAQPNYSSAQARLGYTAWTYADYLFIRNLDASAMAALADTAYARARTLAPNRTSFIINQQGPLAILAMQKLNLALDAAVEIDRLEGLQRELAERTSGEVQMPVNDALNAVLRGRQIASEGGHAGASFALARKALATSKDFKIDEVANLLTHARLAVAEFGWRRPSDWEQLRSDLATLADGLARHPDMALVRALRGRLALQASVRTADGQYSRELRQLAQSELQLALATNALLASRFATDLKASDESEPESRER